MPKRSRPGKAKLKLSYAGFFCLPEERHHLAKFPAHRFDLLSLLRFPHGEELLTAARFVLRNPLLRKFPGLNFRKNLLHLGARSIVDDARSTGIVAVFGGV